MSALAAPGRQSAFVIMGFACCVAAGCGGGSSNSSTTSTPTPSGTFTLTTVASFNGPNGSYPEAGLITDGQGNFYGTTAWGGSGYGSSVFTGSGSVYKYTAASGITTIASFSGPNGTHPLAGVIMDAQGNLYGATSQGGTSGDGTIFECNATSGITMLASFNGSNGQYPYAGLLADGQGNYYGTTSWGSDNFNGSGFTGDGTVFKYSVAAGITTPVSFNGSNGQNPQAGLISDGQGNFYGTTESGGSDNDGTIFKYSVTTGLTTLASFDSTNGAYPVGGLITDGQGNYYGTTSVGGSDGDGTIFKYNSSSGITTLESFNGGNGQYPYAGLVMDAQGDLYGTTAYGGSGFNGNAKTGNGTIFEYSAASVFSTVVLLSGGNGSNPYAGLVSDGQGDFYGTTLGGGSAGYGTIYELVPKAASPATRPNAARMSSSAG